MYNQNKNKYRILLLFVLLYNYIGFDIKFKKYIIYYKFFIIY